MEEVVGREVGLALHVCYNSTCLLCTAGKLPERSASDLLRDERGLRSRGVDERKPPFHPSLGRGLVPGSMLDLGGGHSPAAQSKSRKSVASKVPLLTQESSCYCVLSLPPEEGSSYSETTAK